MTTPTNNTPAQQLLTTIEKLGGDLFALSRQLVWQADLAALAAPHYRGSLSLDGLVETLCSVAHHLHTVGQRLESLALQQRHGSPAQKAERARPTLHTV